MGKETNGEARTREENEDSQAQADIWKYVFGFTEMAVVKCAIELGIADFLESNQQPVSLNQLSVALGCCSSSLYRVLRYCYIVVICEVVNNQKDTIRKIFNLQTMFNK